MSLVKTSHVETIDDLEKYDEEPFTYESSDGEEVVDTVSTDSAEIKYPFRYFSAYPMRHVGQLIKDFDKPKIPYIFCVNEFIDHKTGLRLSKAIYANYLIENIRFLGYKFLHKMITLRFNRKGNLLCGVSPYGKGFVVNSWPLGWSVKFDVPDKKIREVHFSTYSGCSDMILVSDINELLFTSLLPSGDIKVMHTYKGENDDQSEHLVVNPQAEYEIISVGWDGDIWMTDTRDYSSYHMNKHSTDKMGMLHVAHHPLKPEICVCGSDRYVYVYDKRNMTNPTHKLGPCNVKIDDFFADRCEYNYLGTEILVTYNRKIADVYENVSSETPRKYLYRIKSFDNWNSANFMGYTSEYIVTSHGGMGNYNHIYFWDKQTQALVNFHYFFMLEKAAVHPHEYVVAFTNNHNDAQLLFPSFINDKPLTLKRMLSHYGPAVVYDSRIESYTPLF